MKNIAISLFVLGVVSVNAGTVTTTSSGSSSGPSGVPATASGALAASGFAAIVGNPQFASADCFDQGHNQNWGGAECEWDDECHNDVHIGHAGEGASGSAVS